MRMLRTPRLAFSFVLGLAMAAGGIFTVTAQPQTCGLLTSDEIQALAPNQNVTGAKVSTNQGAGAVTCSYEWGASNQHFTLALSVQPAARMFVGMSAESIKRSC